jgi:hypothetical protein
LFTPFNLDHILNEARRPAIEMFITDFVWTSSWCERFMRRNGVCVCVQKLYKESVASNENNSENDVSGSDDDFLSFYDE